MKLEKELVNAIQQANKKTTSAYDTLATVTRIDGSTAWVHVDGGVEETPVEMTIACKKGDKVRVRFSGGYAYTIGNSTAPPTDDYTAIIAKNTAFFAKTTAVDAKDTADRVDKTTKPAYVNYTTYYKLAEIEPLKPSDDTWEEEGWSVEQPMWSEDDDRMMWYSIRVQKVSGAIEWSDPHELTAYANIQILRNAIISEVGEYFITGAIQDSDGEDILDSDSNPIYGNITNVVPIYSRITQTAEAILSEVVKIGDSGIDEMSSAMLQNAYGVNIYNDIDSVGDTYAHIDGDSFDIKTVNTAGRIDDTNDKVIASFGQVITLGCWGATNGTWQLTQNGLQYETNEVTREYDALYGLSKIELKHKIQSPSATYYSKVESDGKATFYGQTTAPITPAPSLTASTAINGGRIDCYALVGTYIQNSDGVSIGDNYATSEKPIGSFTNGKPLYQKTINFGTLPNNGSQSSPHNLTNIDKIWIHDGWVDGTVLSIAGAFPLQLGISDRTGATWAFYVNKSYIICDTHGDASAYTASITVRYTKTTD